MKTVFFFMFSFIFYSNLAFGQTAKLDDNEVKVLKQLGEKLGLAGKKEWDMYKDPCSGEGNWGRGEYKKGFEVSVQCDCSFERNATCHVYRIDLSFNNLTSEIPRSFSQLGKTDYIYLTQNNITGPLPGWIFSSTKTVDVSYNRFSWGTSGPNNCPREGTVNMVESYASSANKQNKIHSCLKKDFPCPNSAEQQSYSLYINCGGREVNINTTTKYEADVEAKGASTYYMGRNWAFSSTGNFLDDDIDSDLYTLSNTSSLHKVSTSETQLYKTARTAPISLTYYGLCLLNGNYTVRLHFAEIIFSQDNSFNSLGKRVFDVYVQGELKLKDFDIVKEAGGTGRPDIKRFIVDVTSNTVKIQLFWAGKGTTGIPLRGSYGPYYICYIC